MRADWTALAAKINSFLLSRPYFDRFLRFSCCNINLRDGSLICVGKGNPEWNCSAPHGAGRLMSRKDAVASLNLEEYRRQMDGIYTSCISRSTLDEAPMAYKSMEEILSKIGPTVDVLQQIRPVYNFKAGE